MISDQNNSFIIKRALIILLTLFLTLPSMIGQGRSGKGNPVVPGETVAPQLSGINLELLFDGIADLYYYGDSETNHFLIAHQNGRVFTLNIPKQVWRQDADEGSSSYGGSTSVLKLAMADAPELQEKISRITPDRESLVSLMHDYHVVIAGSVDGILYELLPPALIPHIGFFAGYNADFLKAGNSDDLYGFKMDPAFYPSAGISFKAFLPRISRNLSLTLDLSVGKRYVYGYYNSGNFAAPVTDAYYELHLHNYLFMTDFQLGYNFSMGHIKPFASGGICTRTIISDNSRIDADVCYDGLVISDSYDYSTDEKTSFGMIMSLGLSFDIFREIFLTTSINYSEVFVSPSFGSYRSAGVTIGASF